MNTRGAKPNDPKSGDDLGRHQRVLDAYLAHTGSDPLPPPGLDAKLLALAASSVKATANTPQHGENAFALPNTDQISSINTTVRSRRRQWPFALAASVATIGFAAILARTSFQSTPGYGEPGYQAGGYEAKSVAQEQAPAASTPLAVETPAPLQESAAPQEERMLANRDQAGSVAGMSATEDKAKLSSTSDPEFERAAERALGRVPAAPENAAPTPVDSDSGTTSAAAAAKPAPEVVVTKGELAKAEPAFAPPPAPAVAPEPASTWAADTTPMADSAADVPVAAPAAAADTRSRRGEVDAAPIVNIPAENGVAETAAAPVSPAKTIERGAILAEAKPVPSTSTQTQATESQPELGLVRRESPQAGASAPPLDATNSKKDEFAPDAQAGPGNPHAKTFAAIRALRDSGELLKAKAMLARFRKAYSRVVLPEDLKVLEKAK